MSSHPRKTATAATLATILAAGCSDPAEQLRLEEQNVATVVRDINTFLDSMARARAASEKPDPATLEISQAITQYYQRESQKLDAPFNRERLRGFLLQYVNLSPRGRQQVDDQVTAMIAESSGDLTSSGEVVVDLFRKEALKTIEGTFREISSQLQGR